MIKHLMHGASIGAFLASIFYLLLASSVTIIKIEYSIATALLSIAAAAISKNEKDT